MDEHEFFPGDFVVESKDGFHPHNYGVIQVRVAFFFMPLFFSRYSFNVFAIFAVKLPDIPIANSIYH